MTSSSFDGDEVYDHFQIESGSLTNYEVSVEDYAAQWIRARERNGVYVTADEQARLAHALPSVGHLRLREVRPRHIRDMVVAVRQRISKRTGKALAPRTVRSVYQILHNMFECAVIDDVIEWNPVRLRPCDLPPDIDVDPEWRWQAMYSSAEVARLVSDSLIHPCRRVLNALKCLAGLRHGEAAACCWRHLDETVEPLARLWIVRSWNPKHGMKRTKDTCVRAIPVHSILMRILLIWRRDYWPRLYGRLPTADDLIVATTKMTPLDRTCAQQAMKRDLRNLGLRVRAGAARSRGGHDLRSWFMTQLIEDGANGDIVVSTTHSIRSRRDVVSGYRRFGWKVLCHEVSKLSLELPDGDPLAWDWKIRRPRRKRSDGNEDTGTT